MAGEDDDTRNFVQRERDGTETSVFSGNTPRQAALKAARRLEDVGRSERRADRHEVRIRERGTDTVHIYEAWAWEETPPEDAPEWLQEQDAIVEANVSKQGIEHLEE